MRLVVWLVVDYSALRKLVVDYFAYAVRPGASARRVARHAACRRLLRLRRATGCLGTSCGSSRRSSSTTSPTPCVRVPRHIARLITRLVALLVVDYFAYAVRPGASAHHVVRRRLLRLRRASGCLGTSRGSSSGSSRRSSSTTSPTSRVWVPRHVAQLVTRLFVDYSMRRHSTLATLCMRLLVSQQHRLYFEYTARRRDIIFRSHRINHSSRLVFQSSRERQSRPQQLIEINSD
jgi:hypothetical protein